MNFLLIFCFIRKYALRKKNFSEALKNAPKNVTTKLEGERGKALVGGPLKKITFFAASLRITCDFYCCYNGNEIICATNINLFQEIYQKKIPRYSAVGLIC